MVLLLLQPESGSEMGGIWPTKREESQRRRPSTKSLQHMALETPKISSSQRLMYDEILLFRPVFLNGCVLILLELIVTF